MAPDLTLAGKLRALRASRKNLNTEAGHSGLLLKMEKARSSGPSVYYFYFIELMEIVGQVLGFSSVWHE